MIASSFATPVPDCPPGGHIHTAGYESVSVAPLAYSAEYSAGPAITYAKSAGIVLADKSPAATYAGILPSGE